MITLKDIIDEFMLTASDPDSYIHGVNRTLVLKHAKRCMEDLTYAALPSTRLVQKELPSHKTLTWPEGAIDIIRMHIVDSDGYLTPIYVNDRNPIAFEYLRDNDGEFILDDESYIIKTSVDPTPAKQSDLYTDFSTYGFSPGYGRMYGLRGGVIGTGGTYRYEHESGLIHFFDLDEGTNIMFEYIMNPLLEKNEADLEVVEYARLPLDSYMYWKIIERRSNIPMNEKMRAKRQYFIDLKTAKKRIIIKPDEIIQALKAKRSHLNW